MKRILLTAISIGLAIHFGHAQKAEITSTANISRILNTLASDDMRGRSALSLPDIGKAADFIASEFKEIGLKPYIGDNYRQSFFVERSKSAIQAVEIDGKALDPASFLIVGNYDSSNTKIKRVSIGPDDDFSQRFRELVQKDPESAFVFVDKKHAAFLARFKRIYDRENISIKGANKGSVATSGKVFLVADESSKNIAVTHNKTVNDFEMFNVAAVIPGKTKPNEYVVFSCHYDHIGILPAQGQDSIANGADDDASGTTAMIELARYYKKMNNNERTLIFVAFTAEEIGMFGSKYFSNNINPDQVVAMINIEMIGKDSKFGPNSLYITGYPASDLGKLMQENLKGTAFTFHPDPYTTQNLFYRSDNAVLAALGVPAHTFSTSQIDKDSYYHTVKDEVSTLDIQNIKSSIEAIAQGAIGIVKGEQTPSRVEKLRD